MKKDLHILVDEKTYEAVRKKAFESRRSMNKIVQEALNLYFSNKGVKKNARTKKAV